MGNDLASKALYILSIYMVMLGVFMFFMTASLGEIGSNEVIHQTSGFNLTSATSGNSDLTGDDVNTPSELTVYGSIDFLRDFFSLLLFNVSVSNIPTYWILVRIFCIWLPTTFFFIAFALVIRG